MKLDELRTKRVKQTLQMLRCFSLNIVKVLKPVSRHSFGLFRFILRLCQRDVMFVMHFNLYSSVTTSRFEAALQS